MAEETQYTANTGIVAISTANGNLDGTGTLGTILTGAANGTIIKSVLIKSITNTTQGMVRLFVDDNSGSNIRLISEIEIPAITKSGVNKAFEVKVELNFTLKSGYLLRASTQNAETFNVIAEGLDRDYYSNGVRMDTTQFTANTGSISIATANSNLDGTGTLGLVYTAGSSATYKGSKISSITIKSTINVTAGMVRLFLDNLTTKFCFKEVFVPTLTKSATSKSFERIIVFEKPLAIKAGYKIYASTENAETFIVCIEANDWKYYS